MARHILWRIGIFVGILMLIAALFLILSASHAEAFGTAVYSVVAGIVLEMLYAIYLCIESIRLFRSGKIVRGIINLLIGLVLLAVSLYFTDYYFISVF